MWRSRTPFSASSPGVAAAWPGARTSPARPGRSPAGRPGGLLEDGLPELLEAAEPGRPGHGGGEVAEPREGRGGQGSARRGQGRSAGRPSARPPGAPLPRWRRGAWPGGPGWSRRGRRRSAVGPHLLPRLEGDVLRGVLAEGVVDGPHLGRPGARRPPPRPGSPAGPFRRRGRRTGRRGRRLAVQQQGDQVGAVRRAFHQHRPGRRSRIRRGHLQRGRRRRVGRARGRSGWPITAAPPGRQLNSGQGRSRRPLTTVSRYSCSTSRSLRFSLATVPTRAAKQSCSSVAAGAEEGAHQGPVRHHRDQLGRAQDGAGRLHLGRPVQGLPPAQLGEDGGQQAHHVRRHLRLHPQVPQQLPAAPLDDRAPPARGRRRPGWSRS